jgi:hypothetical protein
MSTQVDPEIRGVFDYFQNLNLLVLMEDLRRGQAARKVWQSGSSLCPVAHGLPAKQQVREVCSCDQETGYLDQACIFAARLLGAKPEEVLYFVECWDSQKISDEALRKQLEALWLERLADAELMQHFLAADEEREPDGTFDRCWSTHY